jgi:transposase
MKNTKHSTITPDLFLGIDVGKTDLFCHIITANDASSSRFDNSEEGIISLISWLRKFAAPSVISACLEQTGHYGIDIAKALHKLQIHSLFLVNPRPTPFLPHV